MSRIPRTLQRIIYRHRRSITSNYSQFKQFGASIAKPHVKLPNQLQKQPINIIFSNNSNPVNDINSDQLKQQLQQQQPPQALYKNVDNDNINDLNNYIELQTFNHPNINLKKFKKNLKKYWNFIPKKSIENKINNTTIMQFEHESESPIYPIIIVNQINYQNLSQSTQNIINTMIDTIPKNSYKNENFLVSGRNHWNPITIEQFDIINNESFNAATLSAFGIYPKQIINNNNDYNNNNNHNNNFNNCNHCDVNCNYRQETRYPSTQSSSKLPHALTGVSFKNGYKLIHNNNNQYVSDQSAKDVFRSFLAGV